MSRRDVAGIALTNAVEAEAEDGFDGGHRAPCRAPGGGVAGDDGGVGGRRAAVDVLAADGTGRRGLVLHCVEPLSEAVPVEGVAAGRDGLDGRRVDDEPLPRAGVEGVVFFFSTTKFFPTKHLLLLLTLTWKKEGLEADGADVVLVVLAQGFDGAEMFLETPSARGLGSSSSSRIADHHRDDRREEGEEENRRQGVAEPLPQRRRRARGIASQFFQCYAGRAGVVLGSEPRRDRVQNTPRPPVAQKRAPQPAAGG
mmetsp:Transcript_13325/g.43437  ORF Transcript_13325/g.43437 Transcript_13325/m.43437 type:complete len:255 (+) Transcript_13325:414-1178(+)